MNSPGSYITLHQEPQHVASLASLYGPRSRLQHFVTSTGGKCTSQQKGRKGKQNSSFQPMAGSDPHQISVLSWNVLAPGHGEDSRMDWNTERLPCLLESLGCYSACDVICLQELEKGVSLEKVQAYLAERGFECVSQKRDGKDSYHVVNATFFRAARFRLHWSESRSRVLLTGLLLPNGRELCVVNVHLSARELATRISQMASSLQRTHRVVSSYQIICGDFNDSLRPESPLVPMLSAHGVSQTSPCGPTMSFGGALDHICVGPGLAQEAVLTSTQKELAGLKYRTLPDAENPSDHLPVAGLFRMSQASDWHVPRLPEPPTTLPGQLEAWTELCLQELKPLPVEKKARKVQRKEQRQVEETFLSSLSEEEQARLTAWREETQAAARTLYGLVMDNALAAVRARGDGVT